MSKQTITPPGEETGKKMKPENVKRNVIIEMKYTPLVAKSAMAASMGGAFTAAASNLFPANMITMDSSYPPVQIPKIINREFDATKSMSNVANTSWKLGYTDAPEESTYIVRGEVNGDVDLKELESIAKQDKNIVQIYADVKIQTNLICPGSAAVGTHLDVERLLCTSAMWEKGMTGEGVMVAIVDTGINKAHLLAKGKTPNYNDALSWNPAPGGPAPFTHGVNHGTMCAFDVCIAAPKCTLLDIALLSSTASGGSVMDGLLSDAVRAYNHLLFNVMGRAERPGENRSLVVSNSWGMFHPSWDFPVGHPGNYSSNPNHPFHKVVLSLEKAGADILFAAGNCGPECPDGRCQGVTNMGIYGANSSTAVLSVAGVATDLDRVGYSNKGPGRLADKKPDITGYTHFTGSGVYSADGGTSAACPVVAGVVAAIRTRKPHNPADTLTSPSSIRSIITSTAKDLGATGYDYFYGYGVVDGCKITSKLFPRAWKNLCEFYPRICDLFRKKSFCERYPIICQLLKRRLPEIPPIPQPGPRPFPHSEAENALSNAENDLQLQNEMFALVNELLGGKKDEHPASSTEGEPHQCNCDKNQ